MGEGENLDTVYKSLGKIRKLIFHYEMKETTTIIELTLWKAKIDESSKGRKACRVLCGADIII